MPKLGSPKKDSAETRGAVVIGIDVGTVNSAFGVSEYISGGKTWKLLEAGMIPATINNLKYGAEEKKKKRRGKAGANGEFDLLNLPPFRKQLKGLVRWLNAIKKKYNPDVLTIERFQSRGGRFTASMDEICSVMVGVVASWAYRNKIRIVLVTAAEWKNKWKTAAKMELTDFYKKFRAKTCPPHIIDASLLGMYGGATALEHKPFSPYRGFHIDWMRWLYQKHGK